MSSIPPPCRPDIFEHGEPVLMTHSLPPAVFELWVCLVRAVSQQPVDWSFFAGQAVVRALGDIDRVRATMEELKPKLEAVWGHDGSLPWRVLRSEQVDEETP